MRASGRPDGIELILTDWFYTGARNDALVLSLDRAYLRLTGGIERQFDRLERDQRILIDTLAHYVRYYLTVSIAIPENQQDAARDHGRFRYCQFITQLARHLQRGRGLRHEIHADINNSIDSAIHPEIGHRPRRTRRKRHPRKPRMIPNPEPDVSPFSGHGATRHCGLYRHICMLRTAMGPEIAAALDDPDVIEVLLNPEGTLWLDRLGTGWAPTGTRLPVPVAERIIRLVACHVRAEVHAGTPILSTELPETGERFMGDSLLQFYPQSRSLVQPGASRRGRNSVSAAV